MIFSWTQWNIRSADRSRRYEAARGLVRSGELREVGGAHRRGEGVALQDVAAEFLQDAGVLHRLDALGDDLDAERLADIDDRATSWRCARRSTIGMTSWRSILRRRGCSFSRLTIEA